MTGSKLIGDLYCTLKYRWGQKLTSSSSLSPSLSSASDDAILFPLNAADDADSGKFDFYSVFHFIRPRKPPVHNQEFRSKSFQDKFSLGVITFNQKKFRQCSINTTERQYIRYEFGSHIYYPGFAHIFSCLIPSVPINPLSSNELPMPYGCWLLLAVYLPATNNSEAINILAAC